MKTEIGYIYSLTCPITNKIRYIGQSIDPKQRYKQHCYLNNKNLNYHNLNWLKWLKKNNVKPIMFIEHVCSIKELNYWEKHYIFLYKSWGFDLTNTSLKEYIKNRVNKSTNSKKVFCYTKDLNYFVFDNSRKAGLELNISYKLISKSICNKKVIYQKYIFSYEKLNTDYINSKFKKINKTGKVVAYNNTESIIFESQAQAAKDLNLNFRNINLCLKGKRNYCGNYKWKYYGN